MDVLPIFLKLHGRPVILVGHGPAAEAKARLLYRAGARVVGGDDQHARLAIVAVEDEAKAREEVERLRARGVLVNAVDRPALSDFIMPAVVDRDPVTVAIGTAGHAAGLAKRLRGRIEALLPAELGGLAKALASARPAMVARWPEAEDRRRALDAALAAGGTLDPFASDGRAADGAARVTAWLDAADDPAGGARLVRVALVSADPDDLTLRQARLMSEADRVYHRANVPGDVLDRARADAQRIPCGAAPDTLPPGLSLDLSFA